ncbi:MAG: hypothetical protein ACKESB_01030 [Candidatus Hodgkinia cicadicola]
MSQLVNVIEGVSQTETSATEQLGCGRLGNAANQCTFEVVHLLTARCRKRQCCETDQNGVGSETQLGR